MQHGSFISNTCRPVVDSTPSVLAERYLSSLQRNNPFGSRVSSVILAALCAPSSEHANGFITVDMVLAGKENSNVLHVLEPKILVDSIVAAVLVQVLA